VALRDGVRTYWTLDEAAGNARLDSNGPYYLAELGGTISSSGGVVSGGVASAAFPATLPCLSRTTGTGFSNQSFTLAGWFYAISDSGFPSYVVHKRSNTFFEYGLYWDPAGTLTLQVSGNGSSYNTVSRPAAANAWHEFAGYLDYARSVIGLAVDGGTPTEVVHTVGIVNDEPNTSFFVGASLSDGSTASGLLHGYVDELGLWDKAFNAEDIQQHWNNGLGRTWPLKTGLHLIERRFLSPLVPFPQAGI
jgi:hypothetical protein